MVFLNNGKMIAEVYCASGTVKENLLPSFKVLSTWMLPLFFSTNSLHSISPRPVPDSP
jgi:hypothetical protein